MRRDRLAAQVGGQFEHFVLRRADERGAEVDGHAGEGGGARPAADAVPAFEQDNVVAELDEFARRGQSGESGADDHDVRVRLCHGHLVNSCSRPAIHAYRDNMTSSGAEYVDVLIIGAGISGIDAAYRIHEKNPDLRYTVLERRERLGGTWDLFRYPGVRSDSDIFTLSFPFEPWRREEAIADGAHIWQYLADTADKYHISEHIRFNTYVRSADWDSNTDTWTVRAEQDGAEKVYQCRFVYFGTGYYNYDHPLRP